MQPYFFPYLGYFQLLNVVDRFIFYDDVQFIRRGWINRNRILVNNAPLLFTVPLKKQSRGTLICASRLETKIFPSWRRKFLQTVWHAYKRAPHFDEVFALLRQVLDYEGESLAPLLFRSVLAVTRFIGIDTETIPSSSLVGTRRLTGQQRIIAICKQQSAQCYVNLAGGQNLYDKRDFAAHDIELRFLQEMDVCYPQFNDGFVPNLSILDVLMFNDRSAVRAYLDAFEWR